LSLSIQQFIDYIDEERRIKIICESDIVDGRVESIT